IAARAAQIGHVRVEYIPLDRLYRGHLCLDIERANVGRHKDGLELMMNLVSSVIAVGIRTGPAVIFNGRMQRLGTVANVVTEPAGIEDSRLFHGDGIPACRL